MKQRKKAVFNWSGGKDSALALYQILQKNEYEVIALLTTLNEETGTSSVHSIPVKILQEQSQSIGIPLYTIYFDKNLNNYDEKMLDAVIHFKNKGVTHFIFGDIFLTDIKTYRENKLNPLGIHVLEPLWNKTSEEVIEEFINSGIKSKIIVAQADKLDIEFIGKDLNRSTISLFPDDVDICGENGEYHTLSYHGGPFTKPIEFSILNKHKVTYKIKLNSGKTKVYEYWQAKIDDN